MVFMHQLQQKKISWDAFIINEFFTTPPSHDEHDIPSSSHPLVSTSPSHLVVHTSPPTHIHSCHVYPTSSPFYNPSLSHHDTGASSSERDIEAACTKMTNIEPFVRTL